MMQPISNLLEKLFELEINSSALYKNIAQADGQDNNKIRSLASVLAREEMRHAELYKQMIKEQQESALLLIDDQLIESAEYALKTFEDSISHKPFKETNALLQFALEFEIKTSNLLKQILELLIGQDEANTKDLIILFEKLIIEEQRHAHNIKAVLKP